MLRRHQEADVRSAASPGNCGSAGFRGREVRDPDGRPTATDTPGRVGIWRRGGYGTPVNGVHGGKDAGTGAISGGRHGGVPRLYTNDSGETAIRKGMGRAVDAGKEARERILQVWDGDSAWARLTRDAFLLRRLLRLGP
ncbi:hypothetical protein HPP92_023062 [Vanilla planifolia]|uniref:Uncharacterized protein n=1 Tax=Vanilla planifolia TaxID=51239 RepID=A0A835PSN2_VANPL|nr:hypothetical protein HPP92_023062 [Vanilla planifolia]